VLLDTDDGGRGRDVSIFFPPPSLTSPSSHVDILLPILIPHLTLIPCPEINENVEEGPSPEEERKRAEEEEERRIAEMRKYGTPVTPESFAEWLVRFKAEAALQAAKCVVLALFLCFWWLGGGDLCVVVMWWVGSVCVCVRWVVGVFWYLGHYAAAG